MMAHAFDSNNQAHGLSQSFAGHLRRKKITIKEFLQPFGQFEIKASELEAFSNQLRIRSVINSAQLTECKSLSTKKWNAFLYEIIFDKNVVVRYILALEGSGNERILSKIRKKLLPHALPAETHQQFSVVQVSHVQQSNTRPPVMAASTSGNQRVNKQFNPSTCSGKAVQTYLMQTEIRLGDFLVSSFTFLLKNTQSRSFSDSLRESNCISVPQVEEAAAKLKGEGSSGQNRVLYEILFKTNELGKFIWALENSQNQHIVEHMAALLPHNDIEEPSVEQQQIQNFVAPEQVNFDDDNNDDNEAHELKQCIPHGGETLDTSAEGGHHPEDTASILKRYMVPISMLLIAVVVIVVLVLVYPMQNQKDPEEEVYSLPFLIDSPSTSIPRELRPNTKLNLTIETKTKYEWKTEWKLVNPHLVHRLHLKGKFSATDINYFLNSFPNLKILQVSDGKFLCDQFVDYQRLSDQSKNSNITSLTISSIDQPCENLYRYLSDKLSSSKITTLMLAHVSVQVENMGYIQELLGMHGEHLSNLSLHNITILRNVKSALFSGVHYPAMKTVEFSFNRSDANYVKEILVNFNKGSPNMEKFQSRIPCTRVEWADYLKGWRGIIAAGADDADLICAITNDS